MTVDYYTLLGVPRDATSQDIKRAFRKIARECHPDVAGDDPAAVERFQQSRTAYESLMDPVSRARYDRRGERRSQRGGSFFDAIYRRTGEHAEAKRKAAGVRAERMRGTRPGGNDIGLDDLLGGFGGGRSKPPPPEPPRSGPKPAPGRDVHLDVDVTRQVARDGGSVTVNYFRMRRADQWTPGSVDAGLVRVEDIAEVRVLPRTEDGQVLIERGMGDAGPWGGGPGDLLVRVRLVGTVEEAPPAEVSDEEQRVDISVVEALLGGRIEVNTRQGTVRMTVPPGTSSHARMRLRGRGPLGPLGHPTDLYISFRIVVPRDLDSHSRDLIEQFASRNADNERS